MSPLMAAVYIFVLSCFVGYHVIWGVTPALHTPLMAVTNAMSAVVIVGAILVAGQPHGGGSSMSTVNFVGGIAVFFASINIFGGFVVTQRMLSMFKKKK